MTRSVRKLPKRLRRALNLRRRPLLPTRASLRLASQTAISPHTASSQTKNGEPVKLSSPKNVQETPGLRRRGRPTKIKRLVHFPDTDTADLSQTLSFSFATSESSEKHVGHGLSSPELTSPITRRQLRARTSTESNHHSPSRSREMDAMWLEDSMDIRLASNLSSIDVHKMQRPTDGCQREEEEDKSSEQGKNETDPMDGRRYPVRNRRHTAVYQIEYPQHNHGSTRNWLAGTGYEYEGKRRNARSRLPQGLQHCGSSTSSSDSDSNMSGFTITRALPYRRRRHTSWHPSAAPPTTGSSQGDPDEARFARRCTKSIIQARSELMPINFKRADPTVKSVLNDRLLSGSCLADIEPMSIDDTVGFDQVGGHNNHILSLKESIILPLMYPEVFAQFGIDPPRGVLFSGPPGTGKTLLARALANECSRMTAANTTPSQTLSPNRPIAFFMRKGADCLSKWVGESERQLRLLFDQAYRMRPSIIFFDEIDGLAPVRSSRQDQIHSSIVSTLLSLMDGLDSRAEVVIIGATNRPDALDPALRRPGRFDREFTFNLPSESARLRILEVHTSKWVPKPDPMLLKQLAHATANYSGADLKALATEACLTCLRRQYPQVYQSQVKLALDRNYLVVDSSDWLHALRLVRPSATRSIADLCSVGSSPASNALSCTHRNPLSDIATYLVGTQLQGITNLLSQCLERPWDLLQCYASDVLEVQHTPGSSKIILSGDVPNWLMSAVWHKLELVQVFTLTYANLVAFPNSAGVCPEAAITQLLLAVKHATSVTTAQTLSEASSTQGVVLYIPQVDRLLRHLSSSVSKYLVEQLNSLLGEIALLDFGCRTQTDAEMTSVIAAELNHAVLKRSRRLLVVVTLSARYSLSRTQESESRLPLDTSSENLNVVPRAIRSRKDQPKSPGTENLCNGFAPNHQFSRHNHSTPLSSNRPPVPDYSSEDSLPSQEATVDPLDTNMSSISELDRSHHLREKNLLLEKGTSVNPLKQTTSALSRLLKGRGITRVHIIPPNEELRYALFSTLLDCHAPPGFDTNSPVKTGRRPPSPQPVKADNIARTAPEMRYTAEQLAEIEREENQLFRRLRQVLRRVVAHLARHRRFAVFTRPVQVDEAPDYYEVIQKPMDLGTIRDRIDARHYTNVEDFMNDIELIYYNAMEYNPPNVPRSRDIRARASEFWDEACLQIEEELHPPDLNERCKAATRAQAMRGPLVTRTSSGEVHHPLSPSATPAPKLCPMPQGDRYSRRLHGQPPVLEQEDIQVLENALTRRRSSLPTKPRESDLNQLREKLGLTQDDVSPERHSNQSPEKALNLQQESISSPICNRTITPEFSTPSSPIFQVTRSPDLSSTIQHSTNPELSKANIQSVIQQIVEKTQGWSCEELLELYRYCAYTIRCRTTSDALPAELQRVLTQFKCRTAVE